MLLVAVGRGDVCLLTGAQNNHRKKTGTAAKFMSKCWQLSHWAIRLSEPKKALPSKHGVHSNVSKDKPFLIN